MFYKFRIDNEQNRFELKTIGQTTYENKISYRDNVKDVQQKWRESFHLPYKYFFQMTINSDLLLGIKDSTKSYYTFLFVLYVNIYLQTYKHLNRETPMNATTNV